MKTYNENRRGGRTSDAGRDGKHFDKKSYKSTSKESRTDGNRNRMDERKPFGDARKKDNVPSFDLKRRPPRDGGPKSPHQENRRFGNRLRINDYRSDSEKLTSRKIGEPKESKFVETRFDGKHKGTVFRPRKKSDNYDPNAKYSRRKQFEHKQHHYDPTEPIRLNKFLSNAGISSRREADEYIQAGVISVNGKVVTELGTKIFITDEVMFHNQLVKIEQKVYLLLNKPKDCVTTVEDTHDRKTVMDIVRNACSERIYPVGRLDRNTTGVLLLTNDGDLAAKLTHPKHNKKKIYHLLLDRDIEREDYEKILQGIDLGDYHIKADALEFVKEDSMRELGIEIHSGQNRVVRRIFDSMGYKILRLDRVYFAGLTKKNLPRGKYRFLTGREVNMLKMGAYE